MLNKKFHLFVAVLASIVFAGTSVAAPSAAPADQVGLSKELDLLCFS